MDLLNLLLKEDTFMDLLNLLLKEDTFMDLLNISQKEDWFMKLSNIFLKTLIYGFIENITNCGLIYVLNIFKKINLWICWIIFTISVSIYGFIEYITSYKQHFNHFNARIECNIHWLCYTRIAEHPTIHRSTRVLPSHSKSHIHSLVYHSYLQSSLV